MTQAQAQGAAHVAERLETLAFFTREALARAQRGQITDMKDLNAKVGALCQEIESMDSATARSFLPALGDILGVMDDLILSLKSLQGDNAQKD